MKYTALGNYRTQAPGFAKALVVVLLFVGVAITGAALPKLLGMHSLREQVVDRRVERETSPYCARFGFGPGDKQNSECKSALADLRHQHKMLLLY
jgi:hypothetical protein